MIMQAKKLARSQRGAMFGLDARIALAIFGTLSVVAGAAIISAISETKSSALATEMDNIQKGYLHYVLDNANDTTTWTDLESAYITQTSTDHPQYGVWDLWAMTEDCADDGDDNCSTDGGTATLCATWLQLTAVPNGTVEALETLIDGTASPGATNYTGNFRYGAVSGGNHTILYKLSRHLNQ